MTVYQFDNRPLFVLFCTLSSFVNAHTMLSCAPHACSHIIIFCQCLLAVSLLRFISSAATQSHYPLTPPPSPVCGRHGGCILLMDIFPVDRPNFHIPSVVINMIFLYLLFLLIKIFFPLYTDLMF